MGSTSSAKLDGSDRKLYMRASELADDPKILEDFDAAYNAQLASNPPTPRTDPPSMGSPESVRGVQTQLNALGYDTGGVDGIAGRRTDAAIRAFQAENGLTVDGIVGPQTLRALEAVNNRAAQPPGPPPPVDGSDRKFYIQASEMADDPAILARFDQDHQAYNDHQTLQTAVDASDRKFFLQADNPEALEEFDRDLAAYNAVQTEVRNDYQSQVDRLVNEQGLEPALAEHFVTQSFEARGIPIHALPVGASTLQFDHPVDGSDRKFYIQADDPAALEEFDANLRAYNQYKDIIGQSFDAAVERLATEQGLEQDVAVHLVTEQFREQGVPVHVLPEGASTSQFDHPVDGSDRKFYIQAGNPEALEQFDSDHRAYNQYKDIVAARFENTVERLMAEQSYTRAYAEHLATQQLLQAETPSHLLPEGARTLQFDNPVDGSDRRLYAMASEAEGDPTILERFDEDYAAFDREAYNDHKDVIATTYEARVEALMREHGYDRALAEDMASLELSLSDMPRHLFPEQADNWNLNAQIGGNERRMDPRAFERDLNAHGELQSAIESTYSAAFNAGVEQVMEDQDVSQEVAERLVGMQLGAHLRGRGVPSHVLPAWMTFNPGQVLSDNHAVFDNAVDSLDGLDAEGEAWSFDRARDAAYDVRNGVLGLDNDGKVGLADLEAIRDNPDAFSPDVVAAAIVLSNAAENNDEVRSYFDQPNFWERVQESPWLDPNTDSFVVNLARGPAGFSPAFLERVVEEGPGAFRQAGSSVNQLTPQAQIQTLLTDPRQAVDNYRSFAGGVGDFLVDTSKLLGGAVVFSNPVLAGLLYKTTGINVYAEAAGMAMGAGNALVSDPDQLARDIVGWEQLIDDPFRWAGNQAPDIILEILGTKGGAKAARAARAADAAGDAAGAGRRVLPRTQELIDGVDAQLLRSDIVDGVATDYLRLQDGTFVNVVETADGQFRLDYPDSPPPPRAEDFLSPPPPRAEDFVSDAPPPPRAEDFVSDAPPPPRADDFVSGSPPPQDYYDTRYEQLAQQGHGPGRHGPDVDTHARALWGIDPLTGSPIEGLGEFKTLDGLDDPIKDYLHTAPRNATRFETKEALVDADIAARNSQTFRDGVLAGDSEIKVTLKLEDALGPDYLERVSGRQREGSANQNPKGPQDNPGLGTVPLDLTNGTLFARYVRNAEGVYELDTIFPAPVDAN